MMLVIKNVLSGQYLKHSLTSQYKWTRDIDGSWFFNNSMELLEFVSNQTKPALVHCKIVVVAKFDIPKWKEVEDI